MKNKILIGVLIILTSLFLVSGTFAVFKSSGSGSAAISAASWSVSLLGDNEDIDLTSGSTEQGYLVTVKNESEVSVTYSIRLTNIPDGVKVKLDTDDYVEEEDNTITFDDVGELLINGENTKTHTLTFTAPLDAEEVNNHKIQIYVDFKQKTS